MPTPTVSIITPVYNGANFLGEAIQSVLGQTYPHFELIIVDDASPDHTAQVVGQFSDPRLKYIVHPVNRGADQARHTGLQASRGEIIALLDQDDRFHPEKLQAHVEFMARHPEIGFTYNSRFELDYSAETIRDISHPPDRITLADLVLWFPLSPTDVVLRREWAMQMDLLQGSRGAEILHFGRLFLAGCQFAGLGRALNYRRYHSGRIVKNLAGACASELNNQLKILADPACPAEVLALKDRAQTNLYLYWAYLALAQKETAIGQTFIGEARQRIPAILKGKPAELVNHFLINSIDDEGQDHETLLQDTFAQLPPEAGHLADQLDWAIGQGYLLKGARAIIWGRPAAGRRHFSQAAQRGVALDEPFLLTLTYKLLDYETEFGPAATEKVLQALTSYLEPFGDRTNLRTLHSRTAVNRAFQRFRSGNYAGVAAPILRAIANDPRHLADRGLMSIFVRSMVRRWAKLA